MPPRFHEADDHEDQAGPEGDSREDAETDGVGIRVFGQAHRGHKDNHEQRTAADHKKREADPKEERETEFWGGCHWGERTYDAAPIPDFFGAGG